MDNVLTKQGQALEYTSCIQEKPKKDENRNLPHVITYKMFFDKIEVKSVDDNKETFVKPTTCN